MTSSSTANNQHPSGLLWLSSCYALYMWAFGALVTSLTLYLTTLHGVSTAKAYSLYAIYAGLLWFLPVVGGYVAEKCGYYESSVVGLLLCLTGMALLCLQITWLIYVSLSLFLVGNCLFTPALWCLVDHLYHKEDMRREAGFTLFYLIFNIGGVMGIFFSTYIGSHWNYPTEFFSCFIILLITSISLFFLKHKLTIAKGRSIQPQISYGRIKIYLTLTIGTVICVPLVTLLFFHPRVNTILSYILSFGAITALLLIANRQNNKSQKQKVYGFTVLCIFALGFWTLYNMEPSLISVFIKTNVDRHLFGLSLSADAFFGFEGTFIVIVGLFLTKLWLYLGKRNKDPSLAIKFGLALLFIGAGFIYLRYVIDLHGMTSKLPAIFILFAYFLFATGELFIGPLGISMVGKLSPEGFEGLFMGIWQLDIGIAAVLSGALAKLSVTPKNTSLASSQQIYSNLFGQWGWVIVATGIIVLMLSPWVKRLLGDR